MPKHVHPTESGGGGTMPIKNPRGSGLRVVTALLALLTGLALVVVGLVSGATAQAAGTRASVTTTPGFVVSATCSGGITVTPQGYTEADTLSADIFVDDVLKQSEGGTPSDFANYPAVAVPQDTSSHTWKVVTTATDGTVQTYTGTVGPCVTSSSSTVVPPPTSSTVVPPPSSSTKTPPGDNGDVKIHKTGTPTDDQRNQPKVCGFYLDAFQFDGVQQVSWHIVANTHGDTVLSGTITLDSNGHGYTEDLTLPDGMYKLYWNFVGEHGAAKHKVFKVECGTPTSSSPAPSTSVPDSTPATTPVTTPATTPVTTPATTPVHHPSTGSHTSSSSSTAGPPFSSSRPPTVVVPPSTVFTPGSGGTGDSLASTGGPNKLLIQIGIAVMVFGFAMLWPSRRRRGARQH